MFIKKGIGIGIAKTPPRDTADDFTVVHVWLTPTIQSSQGGRHMHHCSESDISIAHTLRASRLFLVVPKTNRKVGIQKCYERGTFLTLVVDDTKARKMCFYKMFSGDWKEHMWIQRIPNALGFPASSINICIGDIWWELIRISLV